jgi:protein-disulfide isomerase
MTRSFGGRRWLFGLMLTLLLMLLLACGSSRKAKPTAAGTGTHMPMGFTEEGYPYRGDPNAPVTLVEFSDFQCPYCQRHFQETIPLLEERYVKTGKLKYIYRDFPLDNIHPQARKAAEAARCAGEQGAPAFWAMHDRLFARQEEWAGKSDAVQTFKAYAVDLALNTKAFNACLDSGKMSVGVDADLREGVARGVSATPSFFVGNGWYIEGAYPFSTFQEAIEGTLAGKLPTPTPTLSPAQANPFGADPERPGYTYSGHAFKGSSDAPITIIEISDFQCPYCKEHALEIEPLMDQEYVETGKVRVLFFHFLGHTHSQKAGEAAECAGDQNKFWEMYHLLFEKSEEWWSVENPIPLFKSYAETLGLDSGAFTTCIDTGRKSGKVQSDHAVITRNNIQGTPTFIVNNRAVEGLQPYTMWKTLLDGELSKE